MNQFWKILATPYFLFFEHSEWREAMLKCQLSEHKLLIVHFWFSGVLPFFCALYVWIRYIDLILFE